MTRLLALILLILCAAGPAQADELKPGYLELSQTKADQWQMVWKAPIKGGLASVAAPKLPGFCTASAPQRTVVNGALVSSWRVRCTQSLVGQRLGLTGLESGFNDALMRVAPIGRPVQVMRLTPASPNAEIAALPNRAQVARTYFALGIEHIVTGYDHLLFVLSLVLLISGGWKIATTVTAFTIAHSITLIATTLGWIGLARQPVEICIALSIVFVAVEIVKARPEQPRFAQRAPWIIAFLFGLLHGFGFAGALAEIGLPEREVPMALFTFNLGVEAGQLMIVAAALTFLALVHRFAASFARTVRMASAYGIGSFAAFWMIERALV